MMLLAQPRQSFLLILLLPLLVSVAEGMGASRFAGGSLAFRFLNQSRSGAWTVQISVLSGWKLGDGPCGPSCDNSRQGQPSNRSQVTAGDSSALGSWHVEDARGNTSGDLSASGLTGKMVAVNQGYGWEQELATFDVEVTEGDDVQIRWVGQDWVDVPYAWPNFQRGSSTPYSLAASLGTTNVRNDTGRPNSSPFAYFQMTYTAVLGGRTEISLPVGDPDGDRVNCSEATYFLQGVTDGWDGLELGLRQDELLQFLVKLVDNEPPAPEILSPQEGESYWVYTGATLKVDVAARATPGRSITSLRLSSAPTFPGAMTSSVTHNGNMTSSIEYLADSAGVGTYSLEITATDDAGHEARRHIQVAVREFDFELPAVGETIFNYRDNPVICAANVHCIFPFYAFGIQTSLTLIVPFGSLAPSTPRAKTQVIRGYVLGPNKVTTYKGVSAVEKDITLPVIGGTGALNLFLTIMDGGQKVNLTDINKMLRVTINASSPCIAALCLMTDFGLCQADDTGTRCGCLPGIGGDNCQYDIDECASNPCHNNATCEDHLNYYTCRCAPGYTGTLCDTDMRHECGSAPCQHGGTCHDKVNGYTCDCVPGWTGNNCQTDIDECASEPCKNGGTCEDGVESFICNCPRGFGGLLCETEHQHGLWWYIDSLQEGAMIKRCPGENLTLFWMLETGRAGDQVLDIQWFYSGRSQEIMAVLVHGQFIAMPAFSGRTQHVSSAGLVLLDLVTEDSGNFSVEVVGGDPHSHQVDRLERHVTLEVADPAKLENGIMTVVQAPGTVYNATSGQWAIQLQCGQFSSLGQPPVNIVWQTPSGQVVESSGYSNGQFHLLLYHPVEAGNYTCKAAAASGYDMNCFVATGTITIDALRAQVTLLQAEVHYLRQNCSNVP